MIVKGWLCWVAAPLAQLVERQSHNLKVASSILAGSTALNIQAAASIESSVLIRSSSILSWYEVKGRMPGNGIAIDACILYN